MLRKLLILSMTVTLIWTTAACTNPTYSDSSYNPTVSQPTNRSPNPSPAASSLPNGSYPVQQATYDDIDGSYTLMLLNTPPGQPSLYQSTNLPMARLTDEEIAAGQKSYLEVEQGQPALHLTEDFRIEYVHNVTETQTNSQTGQPETVVVRQEPSFWTPFAGALAGQALGSLLFTPHYYFPPVYQPGVILTGYGGYGRTYDQAISSYQTRYKTAPTEVRNQRLRTSGQLKTPRSSTSRSSSRTQVNRPSGSGYGSSNLRRSDSPTRSRSSGSKFGSGRSSGSSRSRSLRRR